MKTKRIDQITIPQHNDLEKQPTSLNPCCPRKTEITAKYGRTAKDFLLTVTPSQQSVLYKNIHDCYFGDYPTLGELDATYTPKTAQAWLVPQLWDLSEYCGIKEKFTSNQLTQCSDIIANDYRYLKVSEIMLFFAKFKRGCYGRFWGAADPLVIMEALKAFGLERKTAYYDQAKKEEELRLANNNHHCTWDEYAERSGQKCKPFPFSRDSGKPRKVEKTKDHPKINIEERILDIANSLICNLYKCDKDTLLEMKNAFKAKYGCTPEEYISRKG